MALRAIITAAAERRKNLAQGASPGTDGIAPPNIFPSPGRGERTDMPQRGAAAPVLSPLPGLRNYLNACRLSQGLRPGLFSFAAPRLPVPRRMRTTLALALLCVLAGAPTHAA